MRTKALACVLASCVAASILASCGVPGSSAPEAVEPAPTDFDQSSSVEVESFLPSTDATVTVDHFLRAASGDPAGRDDRLHEFTDDDREFSDRADGIGLLDDVEISLSDDDTDLNTRTVTVTGSVVGTYLPDGQVRMYTTPREYEEEFVLRREGLGEVWSIVTLPSQVMMLRDQFEGAYVQAPLYFQATGQNDLLVPDLRWIYGNLDAASDHDLRLRRLLQGPSEWVSQAARSVIPPGTAQEITEEDGVVRIDLTLGETTAELDEGTTDAIAAQIAWSLALSGHFELHINGEQVAEGSRSDWRTWNAIPPSGGEEIGYFIAEDTVWQFGNDAITSTSADHPWVGFSTPGLQQVDVAADARIAAVVATENGSELWIGRGEGDMSTVEGLSGDLRDPQWLNDGTVMLVDDGVLTVVDADDTIVPLAGKEVRSLSVAPDGHRIVYVENGRAMVAPLSHDADGNLQFGQSQRIGLDITGVTDTAWGSEDFVWVAGVRAGYDDKLFLVSIDNAETENQPGTSGFPLAEEIAAKPADPVEPDQNGGEPTIVVIGQDLYRAYTSSLQPIEDSEGDIVQGSAPFTVPE